VIASYNQPRKPRSDANTVVAPIPAAPERGDATIADACAAMIRHHQVDWQPSTLQNAKGFLLSGRFPAYIEEMGIRRISDLTTEALEAFLGEMRGILKAGTVIKYRTFLRALAAFAKVSDGYGTGLDDVDRIPAPRAPTLGEPASLTKEEERVVVAACASQRDRLMVELMLATGVRVSELCALTRNSIQLAARPPCIVVSGSTHDRDRTKSGRDRTVPFRSTYATLPRRLSDYLGQTPDCGSLFAGSRGEALTVWGVEQAMQRLKRTTGIHCNPHKLRHTWATRLVNAGAPMFQLQQAGGWRSIEMVRRYYTADTREMLTSLSALVER